MSRIATPYQDDDRYIDWTNGTGSAVSAGDVVVLGSALVGVAVNDIANGAVGAIDTKGIWYVPAINNSAFTVGEILYWDATAKKASDAEAALPVLGIAVAAKAETGTYCYVAINRANVHGLPAGGADNQILKKTGAGDWTYAWEADATE